MPCQRQTWAQCINKYVFPVALVWNDNQFGRVPSVFQDGCGSRAILFQDFIYDRSQLLQDSKFNRQLALAAVRTEYRIALGRLHVQ